MKLSIADTVGRYGSEGTKAHFQKYKRIVSKSVNASLLKTLRQNFDSVEKVKEGRKVYYQLLGRKESVSIREDGRNRGGHRTVPYADHLDILIMSVFEQSEMKDRYIHNALSVIMKKSFIQSYLQNDMVSWLYETNKYGDKPSFNYYILCDIKSELSLFKDHVRRSLKRLCKDGLVELSEFGSVVVDASTLDEKGVVGQEEIHLSLSNEVWEQAAVKIREGSERENAKVFSVLYGAPNESRTKIKSERDSYLKGVLSEKQGEFDHCSPKNYRWINYEQSKVEYMYKSYSVIPNTKGDVIKDLLEVAGMDTNYTSLENLILSLSSELQIMRKEYITKRILSKYDDLRIQLQPYEDPDWGEQDSLLKKGVGKHKLEYLEQIESKEADFIFMEFINEFFKEERSSVYLYHENKKQEEARRITYLERSLAESGMTDPSFSIGELDPPFPSLPMQ